MFKFKKLRLNSWKLSLTIVFLLFIFGGCSNRLPKEALEKLFNGQLQPIGLKVNYPFNFTQFPPEFPSPNFEWIDSTGATLHWYVYITDESGKIYISDKVQTPIWRPDSASWVNFKKKVGLNKFCFSVIGYSNHANINNVSSAKINLSFSPDSVGADIFFRAVTLPFSYAVKNVHTIEWYLGSVKGGRPHKLLDNMTVCANCHTFSGNGSLLAMDVDYGNDKGSYTIVPTKDTSKITPDKIITWSDYKREEGEPTFGLLSQISPDGRYVLSTVKDMSVFVAIDNNIAYSQLFFPIKGIIGVYDRTNKKFSELKGADDKKLVQSNPNWSPDGKRVIFARTNAYISQRVKKSGRALLSTKDIEEFFSGGKQFKFDLYSIDFNEGNGGVPKPVEGASANGKSNYFARFSPDGKWIVFCQAANFMLLRPDSRLFIMPATGGNPRMMSCNLDSMNSWHSWSPNSKWIVFSSKHRGIYTQLYLTHIDENGNDSPPVLLENLLFDTRAANIPEFFPGKASDFKNIKDAFSQTAASYTAIASDNITNMFYKRAWDNLQKATQIDTNYIDAYFSRILLNAKLQQVDSKLDKADKNKLLQLTNKLMVKNGNDLHFLILHATLLSYMGNNRDALKEANGILKKFPNNYQVYEFITSVLRKTNDFQSVLPYYDLMMGLVPSNAAQLKYLKAAAYIAMHKNEQALLLLNELIKEAPFDYDLLATRIGINIENKDYKSALKDCDFIISKDADNYKYYQMRAQLYLKINDKRNSLNDNKVSLELISKEYSKNKENITLLFERASLLALINNMQDALMDYDRVLANFPINYEALKQKARILISQQQWNAAINSYMILSQNYPQEEEFFNNQAIAYLNMGNNAKAMEELDKTIQLNGENCDALFNRSKLKKMMGNEIGSKDDLSTVIKILTDRKNHGQLSNRDLQWLNSLKQTL